MHMSSHMLIIIHIHIHLITPVPPDRLPPSLDDNGNSATEQPKACVRILVVGVAVGFTELEATFTVQEYAKADLDNSNSKRTESADILSTRFSVAVYEPIKFLNPASSKTHVAIGSTRTLLVGVSFLIVAVDLFGLL